MKSLFLAFTFVLLTLTGCGYSLVQKSSNPFSGRSMYVSLFTNSTYQPEVEGTLRRALIDEISSTAITIQSAEKSTDLLLSGGIESLTVEAVAFSDRDKVRIYRVILVVQASVIDAKTGKVVWKAKETVREEYPANTDMALQRNARDSAIAAACSEMARHLRTRMNQAF